jgi:hypothetical protein
LDPDCCKKLLAKANLLVTLAIGKFHDQTGNVSLSIRRGTSVSLFGAQLTAKYDTKIGAGIEPDGNAGIQMEGGIRIRKDGVPDLTLVSGQINLGSGQVEANFQANGLKGVAGGEGSVQGNLITEQGTVTRRALFGAYRKSEPLADYLEDLPK